MARTAIIRAFGGPDVIEWIDADLPPPAPGEIRFRSIAVGLNFIDIYHRTGLYPGPVPGALGLEAADVVEEVGTDAPFRIGERVATFGPVRGAYATARNIAASSLFRIPDDISDETAAAGLLKGCTAEFLVERCARVAADSTVLVHAAAGGVGQLLVQWCKHIGATVIGTVSTVAKADAARAAGADHVIINDQQGLARTVRELTGGEGVRVTFDGVGMATWNASLDATGRRGIIVSYGNADGPVTGVDLGILAQKGSLFNTRPTLFDYYVTAEERQSGSDRVWAMLRSGALTMTIGQTYALENVALAHADLEGRRTTGSTVLTT